MAFDLLTSTGIIFSYTVATPNPSETQILEFTINSPVTTASPVLSLNVATLVRLGRSVVESALVEHVEYYERRPAGAE
jgi:hypothetical protein